MGLMIAQSVYDFRIMREKGYRYVDKTDLLYPLVTRDGDAFYFISRPRRFGKSLMLSTLENIFRGRRDLFKGLAIDKLDYDWAEYPILHFNFATMEIETLEAFKAGFVARVQEVFEAANAVYNPALAPNDNFSRAIKALAREWGKPVVVLIDEYDAPVGAALNDPAKATAIRATLSTFYGEIKNNISNIRFMMMTGVTRFTQLSVFSALNNLNDLTMDSRYATLLGYTEEELESNFDEDMREHAQVMGLPYEEYRAELRRWYNGYRFSPDCETRVYNPVAIAKTLGPKRKTFAPTWAKTGRPSVLINYLTMGDIDGRDYENVRGVSESALDVCNLKAIQPVSMFYQSGYLTIKDFKSSLFTSACWRPTSRPSSPRCAPFSPICPTARPRTACQRPVINVSSTCCLPLGNPSASPPRIAKPKVAPTSWLKATNASSSLNSRSMAQPKKPSRKSKSAATPSPIAPWVSLSTSSDSTSSPRITPSPTPWSKPWCNFSTKTQAPHRSAWLIG